MGIIGWSLIGLGGECSGIVRAVGSGVEHLKVGDRVATLANWTFATKVFAFEEVCVKIPESLSFEDAATMFAVYSTVIHSLVNLGEIEKGSVSATALTTARWNSLTFWHRQSSSTQHAVV